MCVSCQKDEDRHHGTVDLIAFIDDSPNSSGNSKAYLDNEYYTCWHNGDLVNINGTQYTLSVAASTYAATITGVEEQSSYIAVYPFEGSTVSFGNTTPTVTVPEEQTYTLKPAFEDSDNMQEIVSPMVGYCPNGSDTIKFHNAAGIIKVTVSNTTGAAFKVHYITVTADGQYLAGSGAVSGLGTSVPVMAKPASGSKTITLDCCGEHPEIANNGSAIFYVVTAPFDGQTLTFNVMAEDDSKTKYTFTATTNRPLSLENNKLGSVTVSITPSTTHTSDLFWGEGTKKCPYLITDETDLYNLRNLVSHVNLASYNDVKYNSNDIYYLQTANLDISDSTTWGSNGHPAIGSTANPFMANYNGGGHSVKLNITSATAAYPIGVFGNVGGGVSGATIKNLTSTGTISIGTVKTNVGGLVGIVSGKATLNKLTNEADVTSTQDNNDTLGIAGICGKICAPGCTVNIQNCRNAGTVSVSGMRAGGICGIYTRGDATFDADTNDGQISQSKKASNMATGGIVGYITTNAGTARISNCINKKKIQGHGNCGGMVGWSDKSLTLSGCSNTGKITAAVTNSSSGEWNDMIGGLVGKVQAPLTISGKTTMTGAITGKYNVGGLVGWSKSYITISEGADVSINSTIKYTSGVESTTYVSSANSPTKEKNSAPAGGVVGFCYGLAINGDVTIEGSVGPDVTEKCCVGGVAGVVAANDYTSSGITYMAFSTGSAGKVINKASVTGSTHVGGFAGYCHGVDFQGVDTNKGVIVGTGSYVGGIIGFTRMKDVSITGSTVNKNAVEGGQYVGGIIGYSTDSQNLTLLNCKNMSSVKGTKDVGGCIGKINCSNAQKILRIEYCVNASHVKATAGGATSGVAGIVGNCASNGKMRVKCCSQTDTVESTSGSGIAVGGIIGYMGIGGHVYDSYNTGVLSISGGYCIGGIVGRTYTNDTIVNCYQTGLIKGTITSSGCGAGGIVGESRGNSVALNNCYNTCDMSEVGTPKYGVMGCYSNTANVFNCYGPNVASLALTGTTGSKSPTPYRCKKFTVATGALASKVTVAPLNNTKTGKVEYSELKVALIKWVDTNSSLGLCTWDTAGVDLPTLHW